MGFKRKWLFFVLPLLVLSAALGWVKWKRDHPTITPDDLAVRKRFIYAKDSTAVIWTPAYATHELSNKERNNIAEHIILASKTLTRPSLKREIIIYFGSSSQNEFLILSGSSNRSYYDNESSFKGAGYFELHPITTRILRQWLALNGHFQPRQQID